LALYEQNFIEEKSMLDFLQELFPISNFSFSLDRHRHHVKKTTVSNIYHYSKVQYGF